MTVELDLVRLREVAEAALPWSAKQNISGAGSYYLGLMAEAAETTFTAEWTPEVATAVLDRLAEAERQRDEARESARILGELSRETGGALQDCQFRLERSEAVITAAIESGECTGYCIHKEPVMRALAAYTKGTEQQ